MVVDGVASSTTNVAIATSEIAYVGAGFPIYLGSKLMQADNAANYWSPSAFSNSNNVFREQTESFMQQHFPGETSNKAYQYGRMASESVYSAGLLVAGFGKVAVNGIYRAGAWTANKVASLGASRTLTSPVSQAVKAGSDFSKGAENINSGMSLTTKLKQLENIQQTAAKTRVYQMAAFVITRQKEQRYIRVVHVVLLM